jgi:hypothetical protein
MAYLEILVGAAPKAGSIAFLDLINSLVGRIRNKSA